MPPKFDSTYELRKGVESPTIRNVGSSPWVELWAKVDKELVICEKDTLADTGIIKAGFSEWDEIIFKDENAAKSASGSLRGFGDRHTNNTNTGWRFQTVQTNTSVYIRKVSDKEWENRKK